MIIKTDISAWRRGWGSYVTIDAEFDVEGVTYGLRRMYNVDLWKCMIFPDSIFDGFLSILRSQCPAVNRQVDEILGE